MQDYEIYNVDLGPGQGHEQSGERPAVIVRALTDLKLCIIVPLTSVMERADLPYTVPINSTSSTNLRSNSVALVLNMRSISTSKIKQKIGVLQEYQIDKIKVMLKSLLKL